MWWQTNRKKNNTNRNGHRIARPMVEQLEDRFAPAGVTGQWGGTLTQFIIGQTFVYNFKMDLVQNNQGSVTGTDYIQRQDQPQAYAEMSLTGSITGSTFTFQETAILQQVPPPGAFWLIKSGSELLSSDGNSMTGSWSPGGQPGSVNLSRTAKTPATIVPTSLVPDTNQGGVDFSYQVASGVPIAHATTVDLFWATGNQFADAIGGPITGASQDVIVQALAGTYGPFNVSNSTLGTPPQGATYLLAVSDPGNILGNFDLDASVLSLPYPSAQPTVQTQFQNTNALHKLIYAYQNLAVNVSVTNGTSQEVKGTETFYLSTNQNSSVQGDGTALLAIGNVYLDLQPGQTGNLPQNSETLTVTIPGIIQPGTYYLKATFTGDNDESEDTVAVSPALTTCVNVSGQVSSFASFPQNAAVFDNAVDAVKEGTAPIYPITSVNDIKNFVKTQETGSSGTQIKWYVYKDIYDKAGDYVPAIGYGSDLTGKNGGADNLIFKKIIAAYLKQNPQVSFTWNDYLNPSSGAYIDQATADALFDSGFQVAENYVQNNYANISMNQEAALIDIAYNIGTTAANGTKGLVAFKSMNADIALGTPYGYACAGLELVNSERTTQVQLSRTIADFYLLTSSQGVVDQL
jgi:hypothetical protein